MRNRLSEADSPQPSVAFRLQGTVCNRDAIGARVEVSFDGQQSSHRFVRCVRAGDSFLSESSRWLHFGVPKELVGERETPRIDRVVAYWPDGSSETFAGAEVGGRYRLVQGTGRADRVASRGAIELATGSAMGLPSTSAARVILPAPVAVPRVDLSPLVDGDRQGSSLDSSDLQSAVRATNRPTLLTLWTSTCPHCRAELTEFAAHKDALHQAGLNVIAICLDGDQAGIPADSPSDQQASAWLRDIAFHWPAYRTTNESLNRIRLFEQVLFDKYPPVVVPFSFLLDPSGRVLAIYRGRVSVEQLEKDVELTRLDEVRLRDLATPLPGSWFTRPATLAQFAEYIGQRMYPLDPDEGLRYYRLALQTAPRSASLHYAYGVRVGNRGDLEVAEKHLLEALRLQPEFRAAEETLKRLRQRKKNSVERSR